MSTFDVKTVEKTAALANLQLSDDEKTMFASQLEHIIQYVEKIKELDTKNVEPTDHIVERNNVFRADVIKPSMDRDELARIAPQFENGHVIVPKIIE